MECYAAIEKEWRKFCELIHSEFRDILLSVQRKIQKHAYRMIFVIFSTLSVLYLLALESRSLPFLGWRISQLIGFSLVFRIAGSECPCGPLKPRIANRTTVYWTCISWPAASYNCQVVWKTSTVSCYSTSRTNGWLFISLWNWEVRFCFSKTVVINIACKLK